MKYRLGDAGGKLQLGGEMLQFGQFGQLVETVGGASLPARQPRGTSRGVSARVDRPSRGEPIRGGSRPQTSIP